MQSLAKNRFRIAEGNKRHNTKKKKNYLAEHIHENITTWEDQVNANFIGK